MLTHHAYFIEGQLNEFDVLVHTLRESESFVAYDPGFVAERFEKFGIEEARGLIATASLTNTGSRTLFMLGVGSMTSEAQQALLKLFEEPQPGTQFVLLLPHGTLLATLKSRMLDLRGEESFLQEKKEEVLRIDTNDATEFLASPYKKRSDWVATFLKDEEDARERTRSFFTELEAALHPHIADAKVRAALEDLTHLRQYLNDRAPSLKMILEHLAVTLPIVK